MFIKYPTNFDFIILKVTKSIWIDLKLHKTTVKSKTENSRRTDET